MRAHDERVPLIRGVRFRPRDREFAKPNEVSTRLLARDRDEQVTTHFIGTSFMRANAISVPAFLFVLETALGASRGIMAERWARSSSSSSGVAPSHERIS